jgi:hypothetical protein
MTLYLWRRAAAYSLSPPYPQADMASLSGELAKASLLGEGWGEGVFGTNQRDLK